MKKGLPFYAVRVDKGKVHGKIAGHANPSFYSQEG